MPMDLPLGIAGIRISPSSLMSKPRPQGTNKRIRKIAGADEVELPVSDLLNIWDPDFGWVLKDGKPTVNTKAYWSAMRRKLKQ